MFRGIFYFLSLPFFLVSKIRATLYQCKFFKIHRISKPVIAVGNIAVGGTGKTPFCIELIQMCMNHQLLPAIVSRGYGNDEKEIYQNRFQNIPMAFHANRVKACNELLASHSGISLFVLDDAFQHQKIHRDLNLLLINALDPFGHGYCLPRGFLRESLTAMRRASVVILSHADEISTVEKDMIKSKINTLTNPNTLLMEASHEPDYLISPEGKKIIIDQFSTLGMKNIGILCGIAQPKGFLNTLKKCKIISNKNFVYPDHYQYLNKDFDIIRKEKDSFDCLITTEKDMVKIPIKVVKEFKIYTLIMRMNLSEPEKLLNLIKELTK